MVDAVARSLIRELEAASEVKVVPLVGRYCVILGAVVDEAVRPPGAREAWVSWNIGYLNDEGYDDTRHVRNRHYFVKDIDTLTELFDLVPKDSSRDRSKDYELLVIFDKETKRCFSIDGDGYAREER